jgi:hypothetical protein
MNSRRRPDEVTPEAVDGGRGCARSSTRKQARATECSPEAIEEIAERVRIGLPPEAAAHLAGVPVEVLTRPDVAERIELARAELQEELVGVLIQSLRSDDEAIAAETARWMAERLFPDTFVRRTVIRHLGPDGGPVRIELQVTTEAQGGGAVLALPAGPLEAVLRAVLDGTVAAVVGDNRDPIARGEDDGLERPEASA